MMSVFILRAAGPDRRRAAAAVACAFTAVMLLSGCTTPFHGIPPTPTAGPSGMVVGQSHQHGEGGGSGRLFTRYGGPVNVALTTRPSEPQPGEPVTIMYGLNDADSMPMTLEKLRITHEKPMHLIMVSRDLQEFAHLHPEPLGEGRYAVTHTPKSGGPYLLYNEFVTWDGTTQVERDVLKAAGADEGAVAQLTSTVGETQTAFGLEATLKANMVKIRRRAPVTFTLDVTRDGKPATDLQPFLGAPCHVVIISADTKQFAHTHGDLPGGAMSGDASAMDMSAMPTPPARFGPQVQFTHTFMQAGMYRVWMQFGHADEVVTLAYNVSVLK